MGTSDGTVQGTTLLVGNDPPGWSLVIMGDGYQAAEMSKYHTDVDNFLKSFFSYWPYRGLRRAIDVYRIDVASVDSGADDPKTSAGQDCSDATTTPSGAVRRTYFDSTFCFGGVARQLGGNSDLVVATAKANVPRRNAAVVLVNSTKRGGGSDTSKHVSFCSLTAPETVFHELGHAGFGLADEYPYYIGCGKETDRDTHPLVEPANANVTVTTSPVKWSQFVTVTPTPMTTNKNCTMCDAQANPFTAETVGLFEGADSYHCKAYRPQYDCMMRNPGQPYCVVCQDQILKTLRPFLSYLPCVSRHSGWVLDAMGGTTMTPGTPIQQFPPTAQYNQSFMVNPLAGDGPYFSIVVTGGLVLDVAGASTSPGAKIQLWPSHGGPNQQFELDEFDGSGYFGIRARHSGLMIEVPNGPPAGVQLQQATPTGEPNQQWIPVLNLQVGWRWCHKCNGMYYGARTADSKCSAGQTHENVNSPNYSLPVNNPSVNGWLLPWHWCRKCQGLYYNILPTTVCPADKGPHDGSLSGNYMLPDDMPASAAQSDWRMCGKCGALYYASTSVPNSVCPKDAPSPHTMWTFSGNYSLFTEYGL